jgi:hypothetical protein
MDVPLADQTVEWMVDLWVVGMAVEREQRMVASMAESSVDV